MSYPIQLKRAFIGLELNKSDYLKVKGMIPTPTHLKYISSLHEQKINLIYEIKHIITTPKQHLYLSSIKIGIQKYLFIKFNFIDEFYINENTISNSCIYSLDEIKTAFKVQYIKYPKFMYPQIKKELYKKLVWYGAKLYYKDILNKNILIATALKMNQKLEDTDKYQYKELYKKVEATYKYITTNKDGRFKQKLTPTQLKEAHKKGGRIRGKQKKLESIKLKSKIQKLSKEKNFLKSNNKVNISKIAKELNLSRTTVTKYLSYDHNTNS